MTYAIVDNIRSELKKIPINTTSDVTEASVLEFLDQADAQINMFIGKRYATPVTASESIKILRKIEIDFVVYRVTKILDLTKSVPIPVDGIAQDITEGSAYRESLKRLKDIRDNIMDLPDATLLDATSGLNSFHSDPANSNIVSVFDKEQQQW